MIINAERSSILLSILHLLILIKDKAAIGRPDSYWFGCIMMLCKLASYASSSHATFSFCYLMIVLTRGENAKLMCEDVSWVSWWRGYHWWVCCEGDSELVVCIFPISGRCFATPTGLATLWRRINTSISLAKGWRETAGNLSCSPDFLLFHPTSLIMGWQQQTWISL